MAGSLLRFENVRVVLGESNVQVRSAARGALASQGFRNIIDAGSFAPLSEAVSSNAVDLIVCDVNLLGGDPFILFSKIRHREVGNNPFLLIIVTMESPTVEAVQRVFSSGADDLLVKPLSPRQLMQRIEALAKARKPFVVTHDYIGPDRRKEARPGEGAPAPLIDVPNPLNCKVFGNMDSARLQVLVDKASDQINEHKMERHSAQISWLVERIEPVLRKGGSAELTGNLNRLLHVAEDLGRRLKGTRFAHVGELANSLVGLATRLRDTAKSPDPTDIDLLPKMALAVRRAFDPEAGGADVALEITETVGSGTGKKQPPASPS
ncbi:MAG: response regulator [Alphaproteobacteria bacterium]|nr:response regulator [Alphaproteobacteria bacterium]MBF0128594.1 response regulator [Alphaproteobacteria bacterium]